MISIIICSISPHLAASISENIRKTIGIPFELIITDNSLSKRSICKVYNEAIDKSNNNILCFVHEDVVFHTNNWGVNLVNHLKEPDTGLIGIAGGDAISSVPSSWFNPCKSAELNIIQHSNGIHSSAVHQKASQYPEELVRRKVVALDGVFICAKKEIFNTIRFDESLLTGFHGYDIDISLQATELKTNYVVSDILLEHYSPGTINKEWLNAITLISKKWKSKLPRFTNMPTKQEASEYYWHTLHQFITHQINLCYTPFTIYKNAITYCLTKNITFKRILSLHKHILVEYSNKSKISKQAERLALLNHSPKSSL